MTTNFPTSVDSFPDPFATDRLDNPPHDVLHTNVNSAVEAIETALLDGAPLHIDDVNERVGIGTTTPESTLEVNGILTANHIHGNIAGAVYLHVKNTSGVTIPAGSPVYATGSVGASGATEVAISDADVASTMPALGIVDSELVANAEGHATVLGVAKGLDTSAYSVNDSLYVSTSGGLTNTRPTGASELVQKIGRVIRADASTGEILVLGAGRSNDVPNNIVAGGLTIDTDTLHVDATNNRVGIGTTTPSTALHVDGSILANDSVTIGDGGEYVAGSIYSDANWGMIFRAKQASPTQADFRWANSADTERMRIDSSGRVGIGTNSPNSSLSVTGVNSETRPLLDLQTSVASGESGNYQRGIRLLNSSMTAGQELLVAVGRSDNTRNQGQMYFQYSGDGSTSNRLSFGLYAVDDVLNIMGNGRVGIGTTSPSYKLDVNGPEDTASRINISSGNTSYRYLMRFSRNNSVLTNGIFCDTGAAYFGTPSDANLKTSVESIATPDALVSLNQLRAVNYRYLLDTEDVVRTGFIAQEVEEVLPEAVKRVGGGHPTSQLVLDDNGDPQYTTVDENGDPLIQEEPDLILTWEPITTTLVAAVQELSSLVTTLTARIEALETS